METADEELNSLEFTPTWIVAVVCFFIVLISLCVARSLHKLGKLLHRKKQDALYEALEKLKEELMLLGFISLLLTVFQNLISQICIPSHLSYDMLPCKRPGTKQSHHGRRLLSAGAISGHCLEKGKVPLLSLEALHHLHIFIFVLAVVHVVFCVTTMVLGGAKIRQWELWEDSIKRNVNVRVKTRSLSGDGNDQITHGHQIEFLKRARGFWRKASVISWMVAFFKQFHSSVTKSDYIALRHGFIKKHIPSCPGFDFYKYMLRTLEVDFRKIVGISWYLWFFVVLFLLLNLDGWHTYFWLSFLPLILLLLVGAKLEHIIIRLAQANAVKKTEDQEAQQKNEEIKSVEETGPVRPSDDYFWFSKPGIVLILIHFILFQNSFEIAFFFWIWSTYGFQSCVMEKVGFIVPRLFIGVIVQVLCSYSTFPLYALVTLMGDSYKEENFGEWLKMGDSHKEGMFKNNTELCEIVQVTEQPEIAQIAEQATIASNELTSEFSTDLSCDLSCETESPPFSSR